VPVKDNDCTVGNTERFIAIFYKFITEFRLTSNDPFTYREDITSCCQVDKFFVEVDLAHLNVWNDNLTEMLLKDPVKYLALVTLTTSQSHLLLV